MEQKSLVVLMLRIAGVLLIVSCVGDAAKNLGTLLHPDVLEKANFLWVVLMIFAPAIVPIALGLFLLYFPKTIASGVLKIDGVDVVAEAQIEPLQRVAFSGIGLWLFVGGILDCGSVVARVYLYHRYMSDFPPAKSMPLMLASDFSILVVAGLQLIFGLLLLFGNRGLANWIGRLRE